MVTLIVIVLGGMGYRMLPVDLLPQIEYPRLTVRTNYPNVGPEEIEKIVTDRVENALASVPNVEEMRSSSEEGQSRVTLEFAQGTNIDEAANDVRAALDRIRDDFPPEVESPRLWKFDPDNFPVVIMGAQSKLGMEELTRILEREITQRFEQIPGSGSVEVWGGVYREIQVQLHRDRLAAAGLTAGEIRASLMRENLTLPGGDLREGFNDLYVRTQGEFLNTEEIAQTVVTLIDGKPIRIGDVAQVVDGFQDVGRLVQIDGRPMVRFGVRKQSGANTVAIAQQAREVMEQINREREDIQLMMIIDQSRFIQNSIDNVKQSALWGGILALVVLYVFLRNSSTTVIIGLSIPISMIATFGLLFFSNISLNQMSFGGLALGIGLIVDNAIVVLENMVRLREEGKDPLESAQLGTSQVAGAIIASTLTTCVIFLPVVFMQTVSGMLFRELALVVVFSLVCSLMVALTLVPVLASRFLRLKAPAQSTQGEKSRRGFGRLESFYGALLRRSVRHHWWVVSGTLLLLAASVWLWQRIPVELAPQTDADEISIELEMAQGTNIAVVYEYLRSLELLVRDVAPMEDIEHVSVEIRNGDAEVELALKPESQRSMPSSMLADRIRSQVKGKIPGAEIRVEAQTGLWILRRLFGSGGGQALELELRGHDLDTAQTLAREVKSVMERHPDITDVRLSRREGRPEQNLLMDREKMAELGVSPRNLAELIQTNVGGAQAGVFRESGEEFPIVVRLKPKDRLNALDLDQITIRTAGGTLLPISSLVRFERRNSPIAIQRVDGQRVTTLSANLVSGAALGTVVPQLQEALKSLALPRGFSLVFSGEYLEQQKAQKDFILSILMALILIYMVMAAQFERFVDPLIVMASVPLALIGVVPTLLLTGTTLNIQSLMGIVMLIGIVVNNAIVLVDYINLLRREGTMDLVDAVLEAGRRRLRPILMTASTTILGMMPLAVGRGAGGEIQAALARSVIGGMTVSTLITLFLIPTVYLLVHRRKSSQSQFRPASF
jgi:HAE1 family hydrophobic/amphiphilic exporter-1